MKAFLKVFGIFGIGYAVIFLGTYANSENSDETNTEDLQRKALALTNVPCENIPQKILAVGK